MPRLGLLRVFISVCYPQQRAAGLCVCVCVCVCVCAFLSVSSETLGGVASVSFSKLFLFCGVYGEKSLEPSRGSCLRGR